MIRELGSNDILEASNLIGKTNEDDSYHGYGRNEAEWIKFFISLVQGQMQGDPNCIAVGYFKDDVMVGFLTAKTFNSYYMDEPIMDVKDCIIDIDNKGRNGFIVARLFDYMIEQTKERGGRHWRADSIHSQHRAEKYAQFLQKRYDCAIHTSVRGVIE